MEIMGCSGGSIAPDVSAQMHTPPYPPEYYYAYTNQHMVHPMFHPTPIQKDYWFGSGSPEAPKFDILFETYSPDHDMDAILNELQKALENRTFTSIEDMKKNKKKISIVVENKGRNGKSAFETINIAVDPRGSATIEKNEKIAKIQALYALSLSDAELKHFMEMEPKNIESFTYHILGIREINKILNDQIDLMTLKATYHVEETFKNYRKYLIFSSSALWVGNCMIDFTTKDGKKINNYSTTIEMIRERFTDKELEHLVSLSFKKENGTFVSKVAQALKHFPEFHKLIDGLKTYLTNIDLLKEHNVIWDAVILRENGYNNIHEFLSCVHKVPAYKILNKIFSRLNSEQRKEIKSNSIIFDSYLNLANRIVSEGHNVTKLEPVLVRLNTYRNIHHLLNALNSILSDYDLEKLKKELRFYFGARVVYYNPEQQVLVFKIGMYRAMKRFGSSAWCIQQSYTNYAKYSFGGLNNYYIAIDAKRTDYSSMIGYTVNPFGIIIEAQNKGNGQVSKPWHTISYNHVLNGWWGNFCGFWRFFRFF